MRRKRAYLQLRCKESPYIDTPLEDPDYQLIKDKFDDWSQFKFWDTDFTDIDIKLKKRKGAQSTGLSMSDCMIVRAGTNKADYLATLLHEIVHVVRIKQDNDYSHGIEFMRLFLDAAEYILDIKIKVNGYSSVHVHKAIAHAFADEYATPKPRL